MGWSSFILFVDLKKAFDKAIRELVMGWKQGDERERHEVITGLGIAPPFVKGIIDFIEKEKPVLQQLHLDDKVAELIKSLHTGAWFSIEGCDLAVVSKTGGRQGCRLGAIIFNLAYAVGLHRVRTILCKAGITLKVKCRDGKPFWAATADATLEAPASSAGHDIVEVTYVDDETIMMASSSSHRLRMAIDLTLKTLCEVFDELGFNINFNEGKTEAFLQFRGKTAVAFKKGLHANGNRIPLPDPAGARSLRVVREYKHLGSMLCDDGGSNEDVHRRTRSAMTAYSPIAVRVFGNSELPRETRLALARSLIFSRLFLHVQVWSVVTAWALQQLNCMYMRVLRRIAGMMRFGKVGTLSDLHVRTILNMPSIECYISKLRLTYLTSLLSAPTASLRALLAVHVPKGPGGRLPWVSLALSDMRALLKFYPGKLGELGEPTMHPERWASLICEFPR